MNYINSLLTFKNSDENEYRINNLNSFDRKIVYELAKKNSLYSKSINQLNSTNKTIIITKHCSKMYNKIICKEIVTFFIKWSGVPISIPEPKYLSYYLTLTDKYYNSHYKFKTLVDSVKKYGDGKISKYNKYFYSLINKIVADIQETNGYKNIIQEGNIKNHRYTKNLYFNDNVNKKYLSIDIKSANFNIIKVIDKSVVFGCNTWTELIKKYTDCEFAINSKKMRQVIFGKLTVLKFIRSRYQYHIDKIRKFIDEQYGITDFVCIHEDEIIYRYRECLIYRLQYFQ